MSKKCCDPDLRSSHPQSRRPNSPKTGRRPTPITATSSLECPYTWDPQLGPSPLDGMMVRPLNDTGGCYGVTPTWLGITESYIVDSRLIVAMDDSIMII